jgi:glucokinase
MNDDNATDGNETGAWVNGPRGVRHITGGLGIDVGGTKISGVVIDPLGSVVARTRRPTPRDGGSAVIRACIDVASELRAVAGSGGLTMGPVAIAVPGTIDSRSGLVVDAPVLGLRDIPIVDLAQHELGHPVTVLHDVKAAAFGELMAGAGVGQADIAYLNVGTGLSMAFVFGWKIHQGAGGTAGEIGHVVADPAGLTCNCGRRGCLETIASGPAIARRAGQADGRLEAVAEAARRGDEPACGAFETAARHLAHVLADFVMVLDLSVVMVGGGVSSVGAPFLEPLRIALDRELADVVQSARIVPAALGGESGVIGAAHWSRLAQDGRGSHAW